MPNIDFDATIEAIDADDTGVALSKLLAAGRDGAINETLSHVVSRPGKLTHLTLLLEAGADPNFYHGNKRPLYYAIQFFNTDTLVYCRTLLDKRASTDDLGPTFAHGSANATQLIEFLHREYARGRGIVITEHGLDLTRFFHEYNQANQGSAATKVVARLSAS